jgi:acyl carrier protein
MSVEDRIKKIVANELDISEDSILPTSTFEDLGADSLTAIEIMLAVEQEFDKELPVDQPPPKNLAEVVKFIESTN